MPLVVTRYFLALGVSCQRDFLVRVTPCSLVFTWQLYNLDKTIIHCVKSEVGKVPVKRSFSSMFCSWISMS